ncbi:MAG: S41 family peptidase [Planctomycetota bacterium]
MHASLVLALVPVALSAAASAAAPAEGDATPIRLPGSPAISPDGRTIAFTWHGDVWTADVAGGAATRLTIHQANDSSPLFDPSGETLYFTSNRSGRTQIHAMPATGGAARQITFDSNTKSIHDVTSDGRHLLVSMSTDRGWHYSESRRAYLLDVTGETPPRMLFDAGVRDAAISPDGTKVLFCRGRSNWNRKGYEGPQAMQMWLADLSTTPATVTRLCEDREHFQNVAHMDPMWADDGQSYYYTSDPDGTFDIYHRPLEGGEARRVTNVGAGDGSDDGVAFPVLSRDGDTLLFRRRFDMMTCDAKSGATTDVPLVATGDGVASAIERTNEERASRVAFTPDGKQMAFVAGRDIWVMDRILKEPVRVTNSEHDETSLVFNSDGSKLYFVSDVGGETDIYEVTADQEDGIWWMAEDFTIRQVTDDAAVESSLDRSPNGTHIAFIRGTDIFVMDDDGTDHRRVAAMWSRPSFDWAPDGKWITYATQDDDYNSDVYVVSLDGMTEPFNISRHPDRDGAPAWSGDGKRIAWVGRRDGEEADIYWVELTKAEDESTERDETLKKALEAMKDKKKKGGKSARGDGKKSDGEKAEGGDEKKDEIEKKEEDANAVTIDFDGILDRIDRIRIPDSFERGLIWGKDGKTLHFTASVDGETAVYTVSFPRPERPKRFARSSLSSQEYLPGSKEFVGLSSGKPASMGAKGDIDTFDFRVRVTHDWAEVRQIAFDQAWRAMRDRFYDEAYNNRDWYQVRAKYRSVAAQCLGANEFSQLCNMMLGELNASHMGHRGGSDPLPNFDAQNDWSPTTYHLGLRYVHGGEGPGLVVESVIPGGPTSKARSLVEAGETLLAIDGTAVGPDVDVDALLTMERARDVALTVKSAGGEEREVSVRPVSSVRRLLYPEWVENTRAKVAELSDGKLGYLHIQGMNFTSFRQMEEDLYHAGVGKDGMIIDVRFNGGGSTTDHVLTALTQPVHAITRSRGSGEGYPQDRKIYASWSKPVVVLCNEHSFSNAEILSHAVKQLGRGRLVGMRTAGGVISTGSQGLLDGSSIRMPTRGWYLVSTGEDMELNGCEPHFAFWNDPTWSSPGGEDAQLEKAVEVLAEDVAAAKAEGGVELVPASELRR